jgi:hypothetical protein
MHRAIMQYIKIFCYDIQGSSEACDDICNAHDTWKYMFSNWIHSWTDVRKSLFLKFTFWQRNNVILLLSMTLQTQLHEVLIMSSKTTITQVNYLSNHSFALINALSHVTLLFIDNKTMNVTISDILVTLLYLCQHLNGCLYKLHLTTINTAWHIT